MKLTFKQRQELILKTESVPAEKRVACLELWFPWLGTDDEVSGSDVVDRVAQVYDMAKEAAAEREVEVGVKCPFCPEGRLIQRCDAYENHNLIEIRSIRHERADGSVYFQHESVWGKETSTTAFDDTITACDCCDAEGDLAKFAEAIEAKESPADNPEPKFVCQNCHAVWTNPELEPMEEKGILEVVAPGERMPYGRCATCGAVCHPEESDE